MASARHLGLETTGLKATDGLERQLLDKDALNGNVEHRYKHDVELFVCVLVWVCPRYNKGQLAFEIG